MGERYTVVSFIAARCRVEAGVRASVAELREAYELFCEGEELAALGRRAFGVALKDLGFEAKRDGKTRWRLGLELRPPVEAAEALPVEVEAVDPSAAPAHLGPVARRFWERLVEEYELKEQHKRLLTRAAELWELGTLAERSLQTYPPERRLIYLDRFGQPKERPEVKIFRECSIAFARLLREMGLAVGGDEGGDRPPRTGELPIDQGMLPFTGVM